MALIMLKQMLIVKPDTACYINTHDILITTGDWDFLTDSSCLFFKGQLAVIQSLRFGPRCSRPSLFRG